LLFFRLDVEEVLKKLVGEGGELGMADWLVEVVAVCEKVLVVRVDADGNNPVVAEVIVK
jgi:hypothetical protein